MVIAEIVRECLQFDPALRPSANDIAERLVRSQFQDMELTRDEHGNTENHRQCLTYWNGRNIGYELNRRKTVMINAVNLRGETALMLARNNGIRGALLAYQRVPPCNPEPSRVPEYYHNIDVFGTLLKLTTQEDVEGVTSLGGLDLQDSISNTIKRMQRMGVLRCTSLQDREMLRY